MRIASIFCEINTSLVQHAKSAFHCKTHKNREHMMPVAVAWSHLNMVSRKTQNSNLDKKGLILCCQQQKCRPCLSLIHYTESRSSLLPWMLTVSVCKRAYVCIGAHKFACTTKSGPKDIALAFTDLSSTLSCLSPWIGKKEGVQS